MGFNSWYTYLLAFHVYPKVEFTEVRVYNWLLLRISPPRLILVLGTAYLKRLGEKGTNRGITKSALSPPAILLRPDLLPPKIWVSYEKFPVRLKLSPPRKKFRLL